MPRVLTVCTPRGESHGGRVITTAAGGGARKCGNEKSSSRGSCCESGRYWDRTSDLFRVREARYRCANRPQPEESGVDGKESGRRDSNSRHPPWQGGALPAELRPHLVRPAMPAVLDQASCLALVGDTGIEPVTSSVSGKRATAAPIAPMHPAGTGNQGFHRGGYGIRTRVYGFAGRCLASRPTHRVDRIREDPYP